MLPLASHSFGLWCGKAFHPSDTSEVPIENAGMRADLSDILREEEQENLPLSGSELEG